MPFLFYLVSPDIWSCKGNGIFSVIEDLTDFLEEPEVLGVDVEESLHILTVTYILSTLGDPSPS